MARAEQRRRALVLSWAVAATLLLLVLSSFLGAGVGLFGWGFLVNMMWSYVLLALLILAVLLMNPPGQQSAEAKRGESQAKDVGR